MDLVSAYALVGYLHTIYGAYKVTKKVADWTNAHNQLNKAIQALEDLKRTQGPPTSRMKFTHIEHSICMVSRRHLCCMHRAR